MLKSQPMMLKSQPWLLAFDNDETFTQVQVDEMMKERFTQDQVNTFVAEEKRKTQERQKKLIDELKDAKKVSSITSEERSQLEQRIEDLNTASMTAEEKQNRATEKAKKEYDVRVENLSSERDVWQIKHAQLMIDTEITKAAASEKAMYTEQIAALLIPKTKLVESLDSDGKPSGAYAPKVSFPDTDKDDKPIVLELTVPEAVKRMKELPQYGNLFEGDKKGGVGGTGSLKGKAIDLAKIAATDQAQYRKLRKEKPELFA